MSYNYSDRKTESVTNTYYSYLGHNYVIFETLRNIITKDIQPLLIEKFIPITTYVASEMAKCINTNTDSAIVNDNLEKISSEIREKLLALRQYILNLKKNEYDNRLKNPIKFVNSSKVYKLKDFVTITNEVVSFIRKAISNKIASYRQTEEKHYQESLIKQVEWWKNIQKQFQHIDSICVGDLTLQMTDETLSAKDSNLEHSFKVCKKVKTPNVSKILVRNKHTFISKYKQTMRMNATLYSKLLKNSKNVKKMFETIVPDISGDDTLMPILYNNNKIIDNEMDKSIFFIKCIYPLLGINIPTDFVHDFEKAEVQLIGCNSYEHKMIQSVVPRYLVYKNLESDANKIEHELENTEFEEYYKYFEIFMKVTGRLDEPLFIPNFLKDFVKQGQNPQNTKYVCEFDTNTIEIVEITDQSAVIFNNTKNDIFNEYSKELSVFDNFVTKLKCMTQISGDGYLNGETLEKMFNSSEKLLHDFSEEIDNLCTILWNKFHGKSERSEHTELIKNFICTIHSLKLYEHELTLFGVMPFKEYYSNFNELLKNNKRDTLNQTFISEIVEIASFAAGASENIDPLLGYTLLNTNPDYIFENPQIIYNIKHKYQFGDNTKPTLYQNYYSADTSYDNYTKPYYSISKAYQYLDAVSCEENTLSIVCEFEEILKKMSKTSFYSREETDILKTFKEGAQKEIENISEKADNSCIDSFINYIDTLSCKFADWSEDNRKELNEQVIRISDLFNTLTTNMNGNETLWELLYLYFIERCLGFKVIAVSGNDLESITFAATSESSRKILGFTFNAKQDKNDEHLTYGEICLKNVATNDELTNEIGENVVAVVPIKTDKQIEIKYGEPEQTYTYGMEKPATEQNTELNKTLIKDGALDVSNPSVACVPAEFTYKILNELKKPKAINCEPINCEPINGGFLDLEDIFEHKLKQAGDKIEDYCLSLTDFLISHNLSKLIKVDLNLPHLEAELTKEGDLPRSIEMMLSSVPSSDCPDLSELDTSLEEICALSAHEIQEKYKKYLEYFWYLNKFMFETYEKKFDLNHNDLEKVLLIVEEFKKHKIEGDIISTVYSHKVAITYGKNELKYLGKSFDDFKGKILKEEHSIGENNSAVYGSRGSEHEYYKQGDIPTSRMCDTSFPHIFEINKNIINVINKEENSNIDSKTLTEDYIDSTKQAVYNICKPIAQEVSVYQQLLKGPVKYNSVSYNDYYKELCFETNKITEPFALYNLINQSSFPFMPFNKFTFEMESFSNLQQIMRDTKMFEYRYISKETERKIHTPDEVKLNREKDEQFEETYCPLDDLFG